MKKQPRDKAEDQNEPEILFNFKATLKSTNSFKQVCIPKGFEKVENSSKEIVIEKTGGDLTDVKKDILIKFKSTNKSNQQYLFQKNIKAYPGKVAVMAQFIPSFEESITTTGGKIEYTNDPEDLESDDEEASTDGKKLAFSFIVDRSGSMEGMSIELVKEALQLFM